MKPLSSLLIKPAGPDCNLACRYCFYLKKAALFSGPHHRMSEAVLKETVRQAMQQAGEHISFGWQGGEPTLMGYDFFHTAVQYQSRFGRPGQTVGNGLQTNGWLIDRYWAEFLADAKFLVGLSLDGPEHIHDHYRRTLADQGTWERVVRSRDLLLQTGVEVNALIVVNDYSVQFPKEIYQFHKKNGITFMQFIPCLEPDPLDGSRPAVHSAPAEKYGAFLCTLLDLWLADFRYGKPTVSIRWFDSLFYTYVGLPAPECTLLQECGVYVVVEHNGDVYSCDFFVEPDWRLGNVMQDRLVDLLNAPLQERFGRQKSGLAEKCRVCPWLPHCHGGCPKDRRVGRDGVDPLCPAYEQFFSYGHDKLVKLAEAWKREQAVEPAADGVRVGGSCGRNDPCPCGSGKKYKNCCMEKR